MPQLLNKTVDQGSSAAVSSLFFSAERRERGDQSVAFFNRTYNPNKSCKDLTQRCEEIEKAGKELNKRFAGNDAGQRTTFA